MASDLVAVKMTSYVLRKDSKPFKGFVVALARKVAPPASDEHLRLEGFKKLKGIHSRRESSASKMQFLKRERPETM